MKRRVAGAVFTGIFLIALLFSAFNLFRFERLKEHAATQVPAPKNDIQVHDTEGFPEVDWHYWLSINKDIVGWITIPKTSIDKPIVQAHPEDPTYYSTHDYRKNYNDGIGSVYLDAECFDAGLDSQNCIINGHNLLGSDDLMFAEIANYSHYDFALDHQDILIQTPDWKKKIKVKFAAITPGGEKSKRTVFESRMDFANWLQDRYETASTYLINSSELDFSEQIFTLCTCSYTRYENERTLVYAY